MNANLPELTAQLHKLLIFLNDSSKPIAQGQAAEKVNANGVANFTSSSAVMSGTPSKFIFNTNCSNNFSCNSKYFNSSNSWILDTGASDHMCHDKSYFRTLKPLLEPFSITLPTGLEISVSYSGTVFLSNDLQVPNV